jgi:predicted RNA-binding Zn-ribbon protein involved in translation (DUF1610 family)
MKKLVVIASFMFATIMSDAQNIYPEMVDGKACLVKKVGKKQKVEVLVNENFEKYGAYNENAGLIPAKLNGKWGFYDNEGKLVIPHNYESIFASCNGNYCTGWYNQDKIKVWKIKTDPPIFIDKTGKELEGPQYDLVIETTHEGAGYFFKKDGKWALADKDKKVLTEFKYDKILGPMGVNPFVYRATRDGQDFRLNAKGEEEAQIEGIANSNSNAKKNYHCGYCNTKVVADFNHKPSEKNCPNPGSGNTARVHHWKDLGEEGTDTYNCSQCGLSIKSKNSPASSETCSGKRTSAGNPTSHKWSKQ